MSDKPIMIDMNEEVFDRILKEIEEIKKLAIDGEISITDIKKRAETLRDKPGRGLL